MARDRCELRVRGLETAAGRMVAVVTERRAGRLRHGRARRWCLVAALLRNLASSCRSSRCWLPSCEPSRSKGGPEISASAVSSASASGWTAATQSRPSGFGRSTCPDHFRLFSTNLRRCGCIGRSCAFRVGGRWVEECAGPALESGRGFAFERCGARSEPTASSSSAHGPPRPRPAVFRNAVVA